MFNGYNAVFLMLETVNTVSLLAMAYDFYKIIYILQRGLL